MPREFYRRSQDELSRLYSRAELERQVRAGLIAPDELVQLEGAPIWQPVRVVVGAGPAAETAAPAEDDLPTWSALWQGLARRLGRELESPSPRVVCVCLGIGALGILASRLGWWLWLPWFVLVLVFAGSLMRCGRWLAGIPFALAALVIPFFLAPTRLTSPEYESIAAIPSAPTPTPPRVVVYPHPSAPIAIESTPPATPAVAASTPSATRTAAIAAPATPARVAMVPAPAATPEPAPAATPDAYRSGALVIVRGEQSAGSGFIAAQDGKRYLFTNAHVAAGMKRPVFTLLDGSRLTPVAIEAAVGHDIMRFALKEEPAQAMEIAIGVDQTVRINDEVIVYGNSGGGGVVTSLPGQVVGIGPDRIEVSLLSFPATAAAPSSMCPRAACSASRRI